MYDQTISLDSASATSSQVSEFGPTHFAPQDGRMTDLFGLVPVPANLSARQAKDLGLLTSGTSGRTFTTSFARTMSGVAAKSCQLQRLLESRLQAKTQMLGSTLYKLTWKPWVTPSGRSRSRLRASVLRTSEIEPIGPQLLSGWITPTSRDHKDTPGMVAQRDGKDRIDQLPRQAYLAGWPTPTTSDASGGAGEAGDGRDQAWFESERLRDADAGQPGPVNGFWRASDWLACRDGKIRPVEPGTFPLADGAPARVGRLRGYGNAINAEAARVWIECVMEMT